MSKFNVHWYDEPEPIRIGLQPNEAKPTPLGNGVFIIKHIDGQHFDALVPSWKVSDNLESVPAAVVGEVGGKVILYFPVSNEGRPRWDITKQQLEAIKVA
jgi:hypothetical protein